MSAEKYEVLETSFLNDATRSPGDVVELDIKYDAKRDTNIRPLEAKKAKNTKTTVDAPSGARASAERTTDEGTTTDEGGGPDLA